MRSLLLSFLLLFFGVAALDAQVPAPEQEGVIALTGATIHPVSGPSIENGTIVFENGVITALGANAQVPSGARRVDVSGKHIYPGLIDSHSQLGLYEIGGFSQTTDTNELGSINPNVRAQAAFNTESRHIGTTRSAGILTAISAPGGGLISGQSAAMALDGWSWDRMTLKGPAGMIVNWPSANNENQYEQSLRSLRATFDEARAYATAHTSGTSGHPTDSRWEAMIPVIQGEVPVVVSASDLRQMQDAITWAEEEGLRIILRGGGDATFIADHLARKQIPLLLTSVQGSPGRQWAPYDDTYSHPARLHEAGVRFAIAGGGSAPYANRLPWEAGTAVAFGLPLDEALKTVTLYPAQFFGIDDRVGSLEVGKDASLLITTGHPLEYRTQVEQAYIQGREIDMMDIHRQFYEKYSEKVRQNPPGSQR